MFKRILALFTPSKSNTAKVSTLAGASAIIPEVNQSSTQTTPTNVPKKPNTVPEITDPVWRLLIERKLPLETNNYALQMLLTWAWNHLQTNRSEAEILNKIKAVHLFFRKNQHLLHKEVKQLSGA